MLDLLGRIVALEHLFKLGGAKNKDPECRLLSSVSAAPRGAAVPMPGSHFFGLPAAPRTAEEAEDQKRAAVVA